MYYWPIEKSSNQDYCTSIQTFPERSNMAELKTVQDTSKTKRGPGPKSGTAYPYFDLDDSIAVARAVHDQGGGTCSRDHLAAALKYSTTKSGGFLARLYAAQRVG